MGWEDAGDTVDVVDAVDAQEISSEDTVPSEPVSVPCTDPDAAYVLLKSIARKWPDMGRRLLKAVRRGLQGLLEDGIEHGGSSTEGMLKRLPIRVQCVRGSMLRESGSGSKWNREEADVVTELVKDAVSINHSSHGIDGTVSISVITPYAL